MIELEILRNLAWVVMGAAAVLLLLRPLGVPPILAFMITGLLLGPLTGVLYVSESLHLFSELGVALLLFVVGLELSVDKIRDVGRPAVIAGLLRVAAMFVLGTALSLGLGFELVPALFLGLAASFNSTVIVVKLLDGADEMDVLHGRLSIGILLVEDIIVAIALTLVVGLAGAGAADGGAAAILRALGTALFGLFALGAIAFLAVKWILPPVFRWISASGEALFVAALTWAFAFILLAETLGISIELGAFIAGVALAQLPYSDELDRRVHPLVDFFLAIFFVTFAAGMDLGSAAEYLPSAIVLSLFVTVGGPLVVAFILTRMGYSGHTSFRSGVTLSQMSEFAFILLAVGTSAGLVGSDLMSLVGVIGLITISASAVICPQAERLYRSMLLPAWLRAGGIDAPEPVRFGHIVVIGMNTLGREIVHRLAARGESVVAVDTDRAKLENLDAHTVAGTVNDPSVLEHVDIERAKLVVSALQIEDVNSMLVYRCTQLGVPVSVHAHDPSFAHELLELGADHLMVSKLDGIAPMEQELRGLGIIR